jgi:hypothetical protein
MEGCIKAPKIPAVDNPDRIEQRDRGITGIPVYN